MWNSRHQSSTSSEVDARSAAVQSAPAAVSRSAENEVVIPRQARAAALAAVTPETASSITRQTPGSIPSRRLASRKISGALRTHYTRAAGLGLQPQGVALHLGPYLVGRAARLLPEVGRNRPSLRKTAYVPFAHSCRRSWRGHTSLDRGDAVVCLDRVTTQLSNAIRLSVCQKPGSRN